MADEQNKSELPTAPPMPRGRLFGVRKRFSLTGSGVLALLLVVFPPLYQIPAAMVRDGVVKLGGEYVKDWLKDWVASRKSEIRTGSIDSDNPKDKVPALSQEDLKKQREAECNAQKTKDVDALTERRKAAYGDYKRCLSEWVKPGLFSNQTAEQYCTPKKAVYFQHAQDVKDRQAADCTTTTSK